MSLCRYGNEESKEKKEWLSHGTRSTEVGAKYRLATEEGARSARGYHHGQIKLALKVAGRPIEDQEAGPVCGVCGCGRREQAAGHLG